MIRMKIMAAEIRVRKLCNAANSATLKAKKCGTDFWRAILIKIDFFDSVISFLGFFP